MNNLKIHKTKAKETKVVRRATDNKQKSIEQNWFGVLVV